MDDMDKVRKALFMFVDLFGLERFDYETLVRFIITVKKNYRQVAYHNWAHGFHVANSIYSILKAAPTVFKPLEVIRFVTDFETHASELTFFLLDSVCRCTSAPSVTIWTTEASTTSS